MTAHPLTGDTVRRILVDLALLGHGGDFLWAEDVTFPTTPEDLIAEYAFVVVNSGMKATVARGIFDRLWPAVLDGDSASTAFGHKGKCAAIDRGWRERRAWYDEALRLALTNDTDALVAWCESRPWVGAVTKWHLAKNLGADVPKPDRWLDRLARAHDETVLGLCQRLARDTGYRVATVDVLLWRACAVGLIEPAPEGIVYHPPQRTP